MPNQEHERERERDQTHSYWYIPSAPRVNYSLLVMESAGMMKMATGEGFPPPAGCQNGSRLVLATEACGGGTPDLGFFLEVLGYIRGVGVGNKAGGSPGCPRGRGARPGGGRAPCLVPSSLLPLRTFQVFWIASVPKITLPKVSFRLDSV